MNIYGFIPKHLEVPERPELSFFPLNILFISYARIDDIPKSGTALYKPVIDTFSNHSTQTSLTYYNTFNRDRENLWSVKIIYNHEKNLYTGLKFRNAEQVVESVHRDWNLFFGIWTAQGLQKGEGCKFDTL